MNKRKLSLIFAVSLTAISAVQASQIRPDIFFKESQGTFVNAKHQVVSEKVINEFLASEQTKAEAMNAVRNARVANRNYVDELQTIKANAKYLLAQRSLFQRCTAGLKPSALVLVADSALASIPVADSALASIPVAVVGDAMKNARFAKYIMNGYRGLAAAIPTAAAGIMAKGYYDASGQPVVEPVVSTAAEVVTPVVAPVVASSVGYLAKAKDLFNGYATKEAVTNGVNAVVTGVKNNKQAAIGVAGLATFIGVMKTYDYYTATPEVKTPEVKPVVEPTQEVKPVVVEPTPVKVAPKVVKLTVAEIAQRHTMDPRAMLEAFNAHGYTKAHVSKAALKQLTKLNDGQIRFVVSRLG